MPEELSRTVTKTTEACLVGDGGDYSLAAEFPTAALGEGTPVTDGEEAMAPSDKAKTYTQQEVDDLLQREADRRVTEAMRKAEKRKMEAVREAQRLAGMSAEERYRHQLEQRERAIEQKEQQLLLAENQAKASRELAARGLSQGLVELVAALDTEQMMAGIEQLDREFKESVRVQVERRLAGITPTGGTPGVQPMDKNAIRKLSIAQQAALYQSDPAAYNRLTQHNEGN